MSTILARVQKFNTNRIPKMVQLKYKFMQEDPFRFFRGTCHLFYEDLVEKINWEDETKAWICGETCTWKTLVAIKETTGLSILI